MGLRNRGLVKDYRCFFVTTTCHEFLPLIETANAYSTIYESLVFVNGKYDAHIIAFVIMPNHFHLILYFDKENHLSAYMRDFKKYTSAKIKETLATQGNKKMLEQTRYVIGEQVNKIWKDRFDDEVIRSTPFLLQKLNYIHKNPIRKNLSQSEISYPHSSARFYFDDGYSPVPILHCNEIAH